MQSSLLYTSSLFFMSLNGDIVDTKKSDGIWSPLFVVDDFSELFMQPSIFFIKDLRSG